MAYEKKNRRTRAKRKLGRLASLSKARALVCEVRDGNALSIGGQDENRTTSTKIPPKNKISRFERFNGALGGIRTPDLLVRSQTLYPTELQAHIFNCKLILHHTKTKFK